VLTCMSARPDVTGHVAGVAQVLGLAESTMELHVRSLLLKAGVDGRPGLLAEFSRIARS
jgi:hypothetical protein